MHEFRVKIFSLILNGVFSLLIIGTFILVVFFPETFKWIIAEIGAYSKSIGHWNALILGSASMIESFPVIGVLIPGQQVMLVVGGFYGQAHPAIAFGVAALGAMIGNFIGYAWGVRYGLSFFKQYGHIFALGETELGILKSQIKKHGAIYLIGGKFHNFTRAFVPSIAGAFDMKKPHFWKYNIIGSLLWAGVILVLGVVFTTYVNQILDVFSYIVLGLLIAGIGYIYFFKSEAFKQYLKDKESEIERLSRSK